MKNALSCTNCAMRKPHLARILQMKDHAKIIHGRPFTTYGTMRYCSKLVLPIYSTVTLGQRNLDTSFVFGSYNPKGLLDYLTSEFIW